MLKIFLIIYLFIIVKIGMISLNKAKTIFLFFLIILNNMKEKKIHCISIFYYNFIYILIRNASAFNLN